MFQDTANKKKKSKPIPTGACSKNCQIYELDIHKDDVIILRGKEEWNIAPLNVSPRPRGPMI